MIKNLLFYILLMPISAVFSQNPNTLELLQGRWYIHFSNFPMWLKGDKTNPTFNYTIEKRGDIYIKNNHYGNTGKPNSF